MTQIQHILVPIDFGPATQPGIELAVSLARTLDARITLVHVFDLARFTSMSPFAPTVDVEPLIADAEHELASELRKLRAQWPKSDAELYRGAAHDVILEAASALGCDLIVIGTHGRSGVARAFLGSVAEGIVRMSPIPVLTVHPAAV
jgi:nucleotide-binding universal stress UspA family protein